MPTVGRNQPCPCGSGKRYKECHGAIQAENAAGGAAGADLSWVPQVMHAALRAQRRGHAREAAQGYERVIAADRSNFDATHMLALVRYEQGQPESSLELLRRAIELRPDIALARHNLRVLEQVPLIEEEIGREVLPRLVARVQPVADLASFFAPGVPVHVVIADELDASLHAALGRLLRSFEGRHAVLWTQPGLAETAGARPIVTAAGEHPDGGNVVLFGAASSPLAWLGAARPERLALVVTRNDPCEAIDRIDELSGFGDGCPALVCATTSLAERLRLPRAAVLPEREMSAAAGA